MKKKVIVIGGFGGQCENQHAGGVLTATRILMESKFSKELDVLAIDTTAVMGERFALKVGKSAKRFSLLFFYLCCYRPVAMFTWAAGGISLYEKLIHCFVCRVLFVRPVIMFVDSLWMDKILESKLLRLLHRVFFRIPSVIVCRSKSWVNYYRQIGIDTSRCEIVHNWIDVSKYQYQRENRETFRFLFVGWLVKEKGVRELLDAFSRMASEFNNIELELVGGGDELDLLKEKVMKNKLDGKVIFSGWLQPEEVVEKYKYADALVLPSHGEGFPYVIVEAMAARVPVITTPVGGIPGVLVDGVTAYFACVRDIDSLYEKMKFVYQNSDSVDRVVDSAYELVKMNNDVDVASTKLIEVLTR